MSSAQFLNALAYRVKLQTTHKTLLRGQAVCLFASAKHYQKSGSGESDLDLEKQIHHDSEKNTFILALDKGSNPAVLVYDWVTDGVIDFHHTEVPVRFRGQGLAKVLAKAGMDFAVQKNLKVILSCSYMAKYVADNPCPEYTKQLYSKL